MPTDLILPTSMTLAILSFGLIANWYIWPMLQQLPRERALIPLLFPHAFRALGLTFLIAGITTQPLDPRFANYAAYGDLLAAFLALLAIFALRNKWRSAIALVWLANIEGFFDLVDALIRGLAFVPPSHMGATYFIPMIIVPFLVVSHGLIFSLLLSKEWKTAQT